jgi:hypothetical protein
MIVVGAAENAAHRSAGPPGSYIPFVTEVKVLVVNVAILLETS